MKTTLRELGSLVTIVMGQAPPGTDCNSSGTGTVFVKAGEFGERFPVVREWTTNPLREARNGDTLVCVVGATAGKVNQSIDCAIGRSVAALQSKSELNPDYLYHFMRTRALRLRQKSQGLAQGVITREMLAEVEIPLPPLPEQRRIAAILDHADALRAKRRAAIAKLDSLAQSIFLDMFGDPVTNPRRWPSVSLPEACHTYSGGTPSKADTALWEGDLPWFSAKDLKQNDLFDSIDHISRDVPSHSNLRLLPANTVVTVVRGMILAHTFPVCVLRVPATINQDLKAFIPREGLDSQFLAVMLRCQARHVLSQVSEAGHGTKRLDAEALAKICILLPPKSLQSVFTARVRAIEKMRCAAIEQTALAESLFSALQREAFERGELVTRTLFAAHA